MKTLFKSVIAGSLLVAASAQAGVVSISFDANAAAAEAAFVASLNGPLVVENFDGYYSAANHQYTNTGDSTHKQQWSWENEAASFNTAVGTFTLITPGQTANDNAHINNLMIESKATGEFGREVLTGGSSTDFWLDSNDAKKVEWTFGAPLTGSFNAFGFYIADATDKGATLTLQFQDGSWATTSVVIPAFQSNGNTGYVSVYSSSNIVGGKLTFLNSTGSDGWGIDDITIGSVPEPGALMLMGLGLLGLGAARRRTKAN